MIHRIEIRAKEGFSDPHATGVQHQIAELGIDSVAAVRSARLFFLIGELSGDDAARVAEDLLIDPVMEQCLVGSSAAGGSAAVIEVHRQPGVMDPVAASTEQAIADMGFAVEAVRTARRYELDGAVSAEQRETIARRLLANAVIEDVHFSAYTPPEVHGHAYEFRIVEVPIRELDDAALMKLSAEGDLFLNLT